MTRSRNSEKTTERILEVSRELFLKKGYDQTSIQDIIDQLGGLTKGVVYHHFKSKSAILEAIVGKNDSSLLEGNWQGENAVEKLQFIISQSLEDYSKLSTLYAIRISLQSPSILAMQYHLTLEQLTPMIKHLIEEGIEEQSISVEYPEELAEFLTVYWLYNFCSG